jgi:hypothetical protein
MRRNSGAGLIITVLLGSHAPAQHSLADAVAPQLRALYVCIHRTMRSLAKTLDADWWVTPKAAQKAWAREMTVLRSALALLDHNTSVRTSHPRGLRMVIGMKCLIHERNADLSRI